MPFLANRPGAVEKAAHRTHSADDGADLVRSGQPRRSATAATVASLGRARWPSKALARRAVPWQHSWQHPPVQYLRSVGKAADLRAPDAKAPCT